MVDRTNDFYTKRKTVANELNTEILKRLEDNSINELKSDVKKIDEENRKEHKELSKNISDFETSISGLNGKMTVIQLFLGAILTGGIIFSVSMALKWLRYYVQTFRFGRYVRHSVSTEAISIITPSSPRVKRIHHRV